VYSFVSINASNTDRIGKYINDCPRRFANSIPKGVFALGKPRVLIFALCDIDAGTELRYDYGTSSLPWRRVTAILLYSHFCVLV